MREDIEKIVDGIPRDEWWSSSSRDIFIDRAIYLQNKGCSLPDIDALLTSLYYAVTAEYGE